MRYRLEHLNQVQYAHDENRKAELEAKGFCVVNTENDTSAETDGLEESREVGNPDPDKKPAKRKKAAKEEDKDA